MIYKPFSAMILAAGFGKRMMPLTNTIPKPLIKVHNVSLLKNSIDFLFEIGCQKIVINTHYKHDLIFDFIETNYKSSNILLSHEHEILDTGGGVKNAIPLFDDKYILIINSDIFLIKENKKDVINLVSNFRLNDKCKLLLVEKANAHGMADKPGDFSLKDNVVKRWTTNDNILYYSGIQMIDLNIFEDFCVNKFSFNDLWNTQMKKNALYGVVMTSNWFHVGNQKGLKEAINYNNLNFVI